MKGTFFLSLSNFHTDTGHHLSLSLYFPSPKALPLNLSSKTGERRVEILPTSFNTTQVSYVPHLLSYIFHISYISTLPPNFWVMKMRERNYERFIELLTPPSDVKLLCYIFQLYEWGIKQFTQKDLKYVENVERWTIIYSLKRLQEKGFVKVRGIAKQPNSKMWMKVYELNEENEIVQKLLELFRVVVNGGENV